MGSHGHCREAACELHALAHAHLLLKLLEEKGESPAAGSSPEALEPKRESLVKSDGEPLEISDLPGGLDSTMSLPVVAKLPVHAVDKRAHTSSPVESHREVAVEVATEHIPKPDPVDNVDATVTSVTDDKLSIVFNVGPDAGGTGTSIQYVQGDKRKMLPASPSDANDLALLSSLEAYVARVKDEAVKIAAERKRYVEVGWCGGEEGNRPVSHSGGVAEAQPVLGCCHQQDDHRHACCLESAKLVERAVCGGRGRSGAASFCRSA